MPLIRFVHAPVLGSLKCFKWLTFSSLIEVPLTSETHDELQSVITVYRDEARLSEDGTTLFFSFKGANGDLSESSLRIDEERPEFLKGRTVMTLTPGTAPLVYEWIAGR